MQQISHWLEKVGMSEYAEHCAEDRIDFWILGDLTDQELKELGVVLGDRRKLLRAIAELNSGDKSTPTPTIAAAALAGGFPRDTVNLIKTFAAQSAML